ncbi:putative glycolipid mannosyltransferase [Kockovaella imperatae]|uniref:Alpha-1,3/1,6-mannosyltransferase ALG2 n=1 Tax=Kockovaella imperatae TaxID=4999 RepID=A0A1Y1U8Z3_9TREE|nr:putative glycolipid mannosyltransferase [Kockovaella imperatae]ORX34503.1 putative glycolipid mannosyltransferase [Kockovaella imperatae]
MKASEKKLRIGFIHPDLGIGGAERLVVDAAVSLQKRGHNVTIFTSRHDPKRCFEETRDGTLRVHVLGGRMLPMRLHPRLPMTIVFSILRSLLLTLLLCLSLLMPEPATFLNPLSPLEPFDVFIVDQQSVCVPVLRLVAGTRVVFYCHFPDKLLSAGWSIAADGTVKQKADLVRKLYRWPADKLEEWTTGQSDVILANSQFTSRVYASAFPSLRKRPPKVVYPCIDLSNYDKARKTSLTDSRPTLLSLNRFEAKKNVELAIRSFHALKTLVPEKFAEMRLVIGGGYDDAVPDNVTTLAHLRAECRELELDQVEFLLNFTATERSALLNNPNTLCLLYTPTNEHFGIVPIEAGACGLPVLAVNSGGPTETILDGKTGFLREPKTDAWAEALANLVTLSPTRRKEMSKTAKERVTSLFSLDTLGRHLEESCREALGKGVLSDQLGDKLIWSGVCLIGMSLVAIAITVALT